MPKTLFITMTSNMVFRNLFFFPGSVFDRISKATRERSDIRLVVLVLEKDFSKYHEFFKDAWHERCIMEPILPVMPKTFFEKAFNFFYSYFIYTGTTKTLATIGMRPDEPPAGGRFKKYLAPVKIAIAKTFGKSKFMRDRVVPALYYHVFRKRPYQYLFKKYNPNAIFISHIFGRADTELLAEAKRSLVSTMGMVSCWDHFDKYYLPFKPEVLLAQSEQVKEFAIGYQGYDPKKIILTGHPYFDFMVDKRYIVSREEVLQKLGFPPGAKYILYVSGSAYCVDEPDIIEQMLKWADEKKFGYETRLVIRPYQGGRSRDKEFDKEKYERFETHPRVAFYRREFWGDLEKSIEFINIMRYADSVVAIYSTMTLEAAVLDAPLVGIAFDGNHVRPFNRSIKRFSLRDHFKDILKSHAVRFASNFDELFQILTIYFKDRATNEKEREELRKRMCYTLDGKISERMANKILSML